MRVNVSMTTQAWASDRTYSPPSLTSHHAPLCRPPLCLHQPAVGSLCWASPLAHWAPCPSWGWGYDVSPAKEMPGGWSEVAQTISDDAWK
uniref:Uncharacterized protein n=1 Tax=Knipowitschia caucasica TaxID=637954 RepID=A0AAV2LIC5_KNICA